MSVKLLTEHHLVFLSLKASCTGSFESTIVKMPHCWKSHVTAQIYEQSIPSSPVSKGQSGPTQVRFSFRTDQCLDSRFVTWYLDIGFSKQSVFSLVKALFLTSCSSTNLQEKKIYIECVSACVRVCCNSLILKTRGLVVFLIFFLSAQIDPTTLILHKVLDGADLQI